MKQIVCISIVLNKLVVVTFPLKCIHTQSFFIHFEGWCINYQPMERKIQELTVIFKLTVKMIVKVALKGTEEYFYQKIFLCQKIMKYKKTSSTNVKLCHRPIKQ